MDVRTIRRKLHQAVNAVRVEQSQHLKEAKTKEFSSSCADCQQLIGREKGLQEAIEITGGRVKD